MKASELRLGSAIYNPYNEVVEVDAAILDYLVKCEKSQQRNDRYKPIPITEEWLLKLGFVKNRSAGGGQDMWAGIDVYQIGKWGEKGYLSLHFISNGVIYDRDRHNAKKYVHQLQNLFHALTGEELQYK